MTLQLERAHPVNPDYSSWNGSEKKKKNIEMQHDLTGIGEQAVELRGAGRCRPTGRGSARSLVARSSS